MKHIHSDSERLLANITLGVQENGLNGVITYSNPAHHKLQGYKAEEIVGLTIFDMVRTPKQQKELKEYLAYLVAEQPEATPYISVSYRKDGTPVPTKTDWNYLYDENGLSGFISVVSDFSEYQELREKLELERDLAHHYLDIAQFMLLVLDAEGKVSLVNHELCTTLGYTAEELIGENWFLTCVPKEQSDMIYGLFKDMITGRAKFMEFFEAEVMDAEGNNHLISWRNSEQRDADGNVCGYICSGEDITERRQAEKEKLQLQEELQRAQKMEAFNRLTAGIAHNFNNILAGILGYADLALYMATERGDEELQRYLSEVVNDSEKARDQIKQMLSFSRGNSEHAALLPLPFVKETINDLQILAGDEIQLSLNSEEQIPDINMSPQQFNELLVNTIPGATNDFADTKAKHISINLAVAELRKLKCPACNNKISGEFLEITINDDGPGIAPKTLNELFSPLATTKYITTPTPGLLLAQGILHKHHGHIAVDSIPGYGTTIRIFIPPAGISSPLEEKPVRSQAISGNTNIMIVDDEASVAQLKGKLLSFNGCEVDVFSDSITAVEIFKRLPEKYDCALIKGDMPSLSGVELIHQLLALNSEILIVLFVAPGEESGLSLPTIGDIRVITTPIPAEQLTDLIHEFVGT